MRLRREIGFSVDGVEGLLKVVTGPFGCRVWQDGRALEGEKHVYRVRTSDGGANGQLKIVRWFDNTVVAVYRGQKTRLDPPLSGREYVVGGVSLLIAPVVCVCGFNGWFGEFFASFAGGYVVGMLGTLASLVALIFNYTFMRIDKAPGRQAGFVARTFLIAAVAVAALLRGAGLLF